MHSFPTRRSSDLISSPTYVYELWVEELEAIAAAGGCFNLTLHPLLSGRASRARVIERLIDVMSSIPELWIASASQIAQHAQTVDLEPVWHRPVEPSALVPSPSLATKP